MSAGAFAIAIVLVLLAFAVPALWYSTRRGGLQLADIGLVFVPTVVFVLTLVGFDRTGFELYAYPFFALALSVIALYARVFFLSQDASQAKAASGTFVIMACLLAFFTSIMAPPLYK
jgi:hypothetical protein